MKLQKLGGYASIILVCITIIFVIIMAPLIQGLTVLDFFDPVKMLDVYKASTISFRIVYIMAIPLAFLPLLVVLALEERLRPDAPHLMRLAVIAISVFSALSITDNIGAFLGYEVLAATNDMSAFRTILFLCELLDQVSWHALGWGFLLIGWAAIRKRKLPRILCYIMVIFGIVSITGFTYTVMDFILGEIISSLLFFIVFIWLGVLLLRKSV